jgi:hypothetical protein
MPGRPVSPSARPARLKAAQQMLSFVAAITAILQQASTSGGSGTAQSFGSFPMYDPIPATGVTFSSRDHLLQQLFIHGEVKQRNNTHVFYAPRPSLPDPFAVIVEGGAFMGAWPETQPMAGAMYAARDVRLALNNQLVFTRTQRKDGRIANVVFCGQVHTCHARVCKPNGTLPPTNNRIPLLQGFYLASPMVDVAWYMNLTSGNHATEYLQEVQRSLEALDAYLWDTRNDSTCFGLVSGAINSSSCPIHPSPGNHRGLLWSLGAGDSGEDGSQKYRDNTIPIQSMDMMGYSYDIRRSLARISRLLDQPEREGQWLQAAQHVAALTSANLWREELGAMFERDVRDRWVTTLTHNNLRMMWHGLFTQDQADIFVRRHLMNRSEFWGGVNGMPLSTISLSDPGHRFQIKTSDAWTGAPEGLTMQRSIRALESYGHFAELTLVGRRLSTALLRGCTSGTNTSSVGCHFTTAIDPCTGVPHSGDNYGPMIMAFFETLALRIGIVPRPEQGILWSALRDHGGSGNYSQRLGSRVYTLRIRGDQFVGEMDGLTLFRGSTGARVVTDLEGTVTHVVGIDTIMHTVELDHAGVHLNVSVHPNEVWKVSGTVASRVRNVPFVAPHSSPPAVCREPMQGAPPPSPLTAPPSPSSVPTASLLIACPHTGAPFPEEWINMDFMRGLANGSTGPPIQVDYTTSLSQLNHSRLFKYSAVLLFETPSSSLVRGEPQIPPVTKASAAGFPNLLGQYISAGGGVFLFPT